MAHVDRLLKLELITAGDYQYRNWLVKGALMNCNFLFLTYKVHFDILMIKSSECISACMSHVFHIL